MVFEILKKIRANTIGLTPTQVSVSSSGTISFGTEVVSQLDGGGYVEIYLDRKNNQVGFKPTTNNFNGFKMQVTKGGKTTHIVSKLVRDLLPTGKFESKIEDGFVVINVPEIIDNTKTIKLK